MYEQKKGRRAVHPIRGRVIAFFLLLSICLSGLTGSQGQILMVHAEEEEPGNLYAQSAVLMDADSGRVLFSKNGCLEMAMASTTKIMTCILALEYGGLDEEMVVSDYAASQPKVRLGVTPGDTFFLRDLLHSLMLESHNDAAVVIAENIGKSVQGFADMMNAKAKELGCQNTYFITPNGLDAVDDNGTHHTTAEDLAKIMRYCIMGSPMKELFLDITRTANYQFTDSTGKKSYSCTNHNAFLQMMEGALTGKTGFTGDAGYCYVGALKRDDRTFIVALLACGWPNNKNYKWEDTRKLMDYGLANYEYQSIWQDIELGNVNVYNGINEENPFCGYRKIKLTVEAGDEDWRMLLNKHEKVELRWKKAELLEAPVFKGQKVGEVEYMLNGEQIKTYDITAVETVKENSFRWYLENILKIYCVQSS